MFNDPVDEAVEAELWKQRIDRQVKLKLGLIEDFGEDPYPEESPIFFRKQFNKNSRPYAYAAIKINGMWYTTGPSQGRYTWDELVRWLVSGDVPTTYDTLRSWGAYIAALDMLELKELEPPF